MATFGLRKGMEDIAHELKGIKNILATIWHSRYQDDETDRLNPESFTDEYISTEECAKRLGISDQTIRNWIAVGRKHPDKGWVEGLHYVNVAPDSGKKAVIRVAWNRLVISFSKNKQIELADFYGPRYKTTQDMLK